MIRFLGSVQSAPELVVSSPSIHSWTRSHSKTSTRSSSTVKAQQLAATVEHARSLPKIEAEREKVAAKRKEAAGREKAAT